MTDDSRAPEIRIDQLTGLRTILAPGRAARPDAFAADPAEAAPGAAESCPFCEGREERTPPEVWADRPGGGEPDTPGWRQRAVPNLYPALAPLEPAAPGARPAAARSGSEAGLTSSADPLRASNRTTAPDLFGSTPAAGSHEVIVNHPAHHTRLIELGADGIAAAMAAWRTRVAAHSATASYVHLIVNEGPRAGASLEHSHAQLYALPFVPAEVARERERFNAYHERTQGSHLLEDVIVEEVRRRDRLVAVDSEAILFCPWSSRSPFELRLAPRTPAARFEDDDRGAADAGDRAACARGRLRHDPAAQPLGPDGAARDRGVPLASRPRPAAHPQGRLRARHRRRHRRLPARAGGERPARGARARPDPPSPVPE